MNTAYNSMDNYLNSGKSVTAKQAKTLFKVENVADLVYRLRNDGIPVRTIKKLNSRGKRVFAYAKFEYDHSDTACRQFFNYLDDRHIARARKTLYRDVIKVKIA